jgi:hypothetical protein
MVDGHRPEFGTVVGGSSRHQIMTTHEDKLELMGEIIQEQNDATEERAKELLTQYFSTDDADIQLINASDLFKEFGIRVKP